MKALFAAAAILLAAATLSPMARAEGPRPSSANNWPGMSYADAASGRIIAGETTAAPAATPRYVWQEGYSRGGRWQGGWVLVQ